MKIEKYNYLIGQKHNLLTAIAIEQFYGKRKPNQWCTMIKCKCDCGNITYLLPSFFINGSIKSCGCLIHQTPYNATHKLSKENLYHIWETMRLRCNSPKNKKYYMYGARGIKVCDEWQNNYLKFREWALNNGYAPNLSIDRIDNSKGYSPDNCRWATRKQQQRNTRSNVAITYQGKTQILIEWCEELNLPYKPIQNRIREGWSPERAFNTPIQKHSINL